jgi:ribonucleoside-diphosphate reductase alpha chain
MTVVEDPLDIERLQIPEALRKGGYQGYKIFLDRYTEKAPKGKLEEGDLVLIVTKRDPKFPQKEIGWVREVNGRGAIVDLAIGGQVYEEFDLISKPLEVHPDEVSHRVASFLASCEAPINSHIEGAFEEILFDYFVPGGRILAGAGIEGLTMNNCYVLPCPKDSRHGIMDRAAEMVETHSRGGGVGLNLSSLRPRYSKVVGVNGISSGAVSWGKVYDLCTGLIEQGGSRRGATMLMINDWHPDVIEFIEAKQEDGQFENANMSVCVSDDFMDALRHGEQWNLMFPDTTDSDYDTHWDGNLERWRDELGKKVFIYDTIDPKEIWDRIIKAAHGSAEPGLHFLQRSNKMSNSWYFTDLVATNPCGEQILEPYGVCTLGAIDLSKMVATHFDGTRYIDWDTLRYVVKHAVRMLDNVISLENYHFDEIRQNHIANRRIGLGTMGLADLLVQVKVQYGSEESVGLIEQIYKFIAIEAYMASVDLAKVKGSFPKFEADKFLESGFMKNMPDFVREAIRRDGIRNVCLLTQAPTGTTGTMVGTSTGMEPFFNWQYSRTSRLGFHVETVPVIDELGLDIEDLPDYCVTAQDLSPEGHLNVQAAIQKWVDSSISKTTNCPSDYTVEQVDELYRKAHDMGCKGITIYRDGSRDQQVLSSIPAEKTEREEVEDGVELIHAAGCVISSDGSYSKCEM